MARCTFPSPGTAAVCAFSGGPDSTALLVLALEAGLDVSAVHVHHGARDSADVDADIAVGIAAQLDVACRVEHAEVVPGSNFEARARAVRHGLIGEGAMWGHTLDDQAETVLLALLRGGGATGLSGITPGPTHPMLALRRAETHALCDAVGLSPAADPTNDDPAFVRNRVRHELLELMNDVATRDVAPLLARTADVLRDDDALLDQLAAELDPTDARALAAAPVPLARRAIRAWLSVDGYPPDAAAVQRVLDVAHGRSEACEVAGIGRIHRSHQVLHRPDAPSL